MNKNLFGTAKAPKEECPCTSDETYCQRQKCRIDELIRDVEIRTAQKTREEFYKKRLNKQHSRCTQASSTSLLNKKQQKPICCLLNKKQEKREIVNCLNKLEEKSELSRDRPKSVAQTRKRSFLRKKINIKPEKKNISIRRILFRSSSSKPKNKNKSYPRRKSMTKSQKNLRKRQRMKLRRSKLRPKKLAFKRARARKLRKYKSTYVRQRRSKRRMGSVKSSSSTRSSLTASTQKTKERPCKGGTFAPPLSNTHGEANEVTPKASTPASSISGHVYEESSFTESPCSYRRRKSSKRTCRARRRKMATEIKIKKHCKCKSRQQNLQKSRRKYRYVREYVARDLLTGRFKSLKCCSNDELEPIYRWRPFGR